jgi:protein-L-isoaspartate(D-aspartate) O-methyltransferase
MNMLAKNAARANMLKSQILTGHVLAPRILAALSDVAREEFVPPGYKGAAYVDEEIPLGNGRALMEPLDFARLLSHAAVAENETVLDIGCANGYSAAVLSKLARRVMATEEDAAMAKTAVKTLSTCPNVTFTQAPLAQGSSLAAPYDTIFIEGAIEHLPQAIADQLREGGKILAGWHESAEKVGAAGLSTLVEYRKIRGKLYKTLLRDANIGLLPAFRKPAAFAL